MIGRTTGAPRASARLTRPSRQGDDAMAKSEILIARKSAEPKDAEPGDDTRPKNLRANAVLAEGYGLEVDGKMKSKYDSSDAAFKAGLELKKKFPVVQVKVFAAKEQTRTIVELPEA
jgi:hypothetical protein